MTGTRVAAIAAAMMLVAGCSSGPSDDERFIDELVDAGVIEQDVSDAEKEALVDAGRGWCDRLEDPGTSYADVERAMEQMLASRDAASARNLTLTVGTAAEVYCPAAGERVRGDR